MTAPLPLTAAPLHCVLFVTCDLEWMILTLGWLVIEVDEWDRRVRIRPENGDVM